jgi:hypothetical protein
VKKHSRRGALIAAVTAGVLGCVLGCATRAASLPKAESTTVVRTPECYSLAYTDPVKDASAKLFPVWVELLPGSDSGSVVGRPHPDLNPGEWAALKYTGWKKLPLDSIEVHFNGNYEAAVIHVHRMGSQIVGRATWLSDLIESGPKPSMRVGGTRVACSG